MPSVTHAIGKVSRAFAFSTCLMAACSEDAAAPNCLGETCSDDVTDAADGATDAADGATEAPENDAGTQGRDDASAPRDEVRSPSALPALPANCPEIKEGEVLFGSSKVRVWVGDQGTSRPGPLVIYWHGTCSNPNEVALRGLGAAGIARIKELGGMVAAIDSPYKSPDNFCQALGIQPTSKCPGTSTGNGVWCREDFDVADAVVACAIQQVGIDTRRIHTAGMSAGGLMAVEYADARSGHLASITSYSGGPLPSLLGAPIQDPDNKFAAMIVYGGPSDVVGLADFERLAETYQAELTQRGHFSFVCNHGMGHTIPAGIGASTLQFFEDHPFGVAPEPYAQALPASFPDYCKLP